MLTFLSVALLIYGSMHLYVLGKVWLAFPHSSGLALTLAAVGIVFTLSPLITWHLERQGWHNAATAAAWVSYTWMGYLFLFFAIGLLFDISHGIATLSRLGWPLNAPVEFCAIGLLALAALCYGLLEARQIRIERVTITTPKLASGQVTIAQLSDMHLGMMLGDGFLERVITRLREIEPDIVVATGDIVDGQGDDFEKLAAHFRTYAPPLGSYAVTGNHEYYAGLEHSLRFLSNAGFTVLRGEKTSAGSIVLAGVDDHTAISTGQPVKADARQAFAPTGTNDFIVLLKHQPVVDDDTRFDLQLSGHVHGGQIFPFVYLTRLTYHVHTGLTELADGRRLYVSRGTGTWGPPIRLFAPPEITLITITSANN